MFSIIILRLCFFKDIELCTIDYIYIYIFAYPALTAIGMEFVG